MNILIDSWIPVITGGESAKINFAQALKSPINDFSFSRNDFFFSFLLLSIGIKVSGLNNPDLLDGENRFMQDRRAIDGKIHPISRLPLGAPGESTILRNRDLFIKRGTLEKLCPCCAAMALYSHTQFSGPMGAGIMPGNLSHQMLYLKSGTTLEDVISANSIEDKPDEWAYFSYTNAYWLMAPTESGECDICGCKGPLVTSFRRAKGSSKFTNNPHTAKTKNGKRFSIDANGSMFEIINGASRHSEVCISPVAINENTKLNDNIISFGTHYDKAFLQKMTFKRFTLSMPFNNGVINAFLSAVWKIKHPFKPDIDWSSSSIGEAKNNLYTLVVNGKDIIDAALELIDVHFPESNSSNIKYTSRFLTIRNDFISFCRKQ